MACGAFVFLRSGGLGLFLARAPSVPCLLGVVVVEDDVGSRDLPLVYFP